jgi:hypothetical protein
MPADCVGTPAAVAGDEGAGGGCYPWHRHQHLGDQVDMLGVPIGTWSVLEVCGGAAAVDVV